MRSESRATCTSGLPVSVGALAYSPMSVVRRSAVIDIVLVSGSVSAGGPEALGCRRRAAGQTVAGLLQDPFGLHQAVFQPGEPDHAAPRHGAHQPAIGIGVARNATHERDEA